MMETKYFDGLTNEFRQLKIGVEILEELNEWISQNKDYLDLPVQLERQLYLYFKQKD